MARTEVETPVQKLGNFEPKANQAFYGLRTENHQGFYLSDGTLHVDGKAVSLQVPGWIAFIGRETGVVTIRGEGAKVDMTVREVEGVSIDGDWIKRTGRIVFSGKSTIELKHDGRSHGLHTYVLTKTDNDGISRFKIDGRI